MQVVVARGASAPGVVGEPPPRRELASDNSRDQTATAHVRDTYAPTGQRIAHIDQLGVAPEEWYLPDGLETLADYTKQGANPEQYDGIYAATGLDGEAARVNGDGIPALRRGPDPPGR